MIDAVRLTAGATAALQLLLLTGAFWYWDDPDMEVSRGGTAWVAGTAVVLLALAVYAERLVTLRQRNLAKGAGVTLLLIAGTLGMIIVGESSFGVLTYGPLAVVLAILLVNPG